MKHVAHTECILCPPPIQMTCCTQNNAASSDGATLQLKFPESLPGAGPAMGRLMPLHSAGAEPESGTARPLQCSAAGKTVWRTALQIIEVQQKIWRDCLA